MHILLVILLAQLHFISTQEPYWPPNYSMHAEAFGSRTYDFDLYFDHTHARYRFDSYGVPLPFLKQQRAPPPNMPLYIFLFRYDLGYLYSLWPSVKEGKWECEKSRLLPYPQVPSLFNVSFVQGATFVSRAEPCDRNNYVQACHHFSRDFVLFAVDYFQDEKTKLPAELIVSGDTFVFSNFTVGPISKHVFDLPANTTGCQ